MKKLTVLPFLLGNILILVCGCSTTSKLSNMGQITLTSPAFGTGQTIPVKFTCDGEDISPELNWTGVPAETKSLVLIIDDPDAFPSTFTHWVVYNLYPNIEGLSEHIPAGNIPGGGTQGLNSINQNEYMGPCPPMGGLHHYHFSIIATDLEPDLPEGLSVEMLIKQMSGHQLASGELMGTYQK
jgi:Raf kinase inhibitor-like YbhB/YbcL family protein